MIVIRDAGFGADLDIFALGSRSDKIRLEGTVSSVSSVTISPVWVRVDRWVKGLTYTDFWQGEDFAKLAVEDVDNVPREF